MPDNEFKLKALGTYIDGKIKRYNLMFAVNGGIFALAKVIKDAGPNNPLAKLTLTHLAIGAIAFTFLMWFDIWLWGENMRLNYFGGKDVFLWRGKAILSLLAALLIIGWLLAIFGWCTIIGVFACLAILGAVLAYNNRKDHEQQSGTRSSTPHT